MIRNPGRQSACAASEKAGGKSSEAFRPGDIFNAPDGAPGLDILELSRLETAFREWRKAAKRPDVILSRHRVLLIFLLIRFTGAKLSEALGLDPDADVLPGQGVVRLGSREVPASLELFGELDSFFQAAAEADLKERTLSVDPGHVRRKFYERARACGFPPESANPNAIRKARAVELLREGMPLPVVQRLLGQSTPNLTAACVEFSVEDFQKVSRYYMDKESRRKTSARNTFFGRVSRVTRGDIQSIIEIATLGGFPIVTVITNTSLERLDIGPGRFCSAEVKAPWVVLSTNPEEPPSSAENIIPGKVERVIHGALTTECVVILEDGTELCSIVTSESAARLSLETGLRVWASFNAFQAVINVE